MRIISWNCYRGDVDKRVKALSQLEPDVVCLQECCGSVVTNGQVVASQRNTQQGIAVWVKEGWAIANSTTNQEAPHHLKASISGSVSFDAIGIWTHKEPSYTKSLKATLEANADSIRKNLTILLGDFNSHRKFNATNKSYNHDDLVHDLEDLGLVSAYHTYHGCKHGDELDTTYYWQWKVTQPFHIDYCFLPKPWASKISSVAIPGFEQFNSSDHRPLVVDLDLLP